MERKIGERFEYQGVTLEVCPEHSKINCCDGCYFSDKVCHRILSKTGKCDQRDDNKSVIFKEVTK